MVVNVLVEASTLGSLGAARPALPTGQHCEVMRRQFMEASDACSRALAAAQPVLCEPAICIATGSQKTCDPCCLVRAARRLWVCWLVRSPSDRGRGRVLGLLQSLGDSVFAVYQQACLDLQ